VKEALENLRRKADDEINSAKTGEEFLGIKTRYLGRKGLLTDILRDLKDAAPEEKPTLGKLSNDIKKALLGKIEKALEDIESGGKHKLLRAEKIDVTLPGRGVRYGKPHPVTRVEGEICDIFSTLGFSVVEGPEVELTYYNFEALNIPEGHPDPNDPLNRSEREVLKAEVNPVTRK